MSKVFILILIGLLFSCEKERPLDTITDGLCIQFGDSITINYEEIDYYDFSTHMIYLKQPHEFLHNYNWELANKSFSVYANREEVYTGILFPAWSSSVAFGPYIDFPFWYPEYVIKLCYRSKELNNPEDSAPDPREDERIIDALEAYNQFHAGLSFSIDTIELLPQGQLSFTFTIANNDTYNYYILSPDRMGIGLFHYFTNGLYIWNETTSWMHHQCPVISPEPWDSWIIDWMDLILSGESKSYNIFYEDFDTIPSGQYHVYFVYPGLQHAEIEDINQSNGRIWLGGIKVNSELSVE